MVFHETVLSSAERPELLCLGAAMIGLPAMFRSPEREDEVQPPRHINTSQMRWNGEQWLYEGKPIRTPNPTKVKKTRAQKKAERIEREKARRLALSNTDLRVIDRAEYRRHEHPVDKEVREGLEYLGLNR